MELDTAPSHLKNLRVWFIPGTSYNDVYVYRWFLSRTNTDFSVPKKSVAVRNTYIWTLAVNEPAVRPTPYVCMYVDTDPKFGL
jgi:hypothetical protein